MKNGNTQLLLLLKNKKNNDILIVQDNLFIYVFVKGGARENKGLCL